MVISAGSGTFLLGCTMLATWQAQNRKYLQSNYVDEEIFFFFYTATLDLLSKPAAAFWGERKRGY